MSRTKVRLQGDELVKTPRFMGGFDQTIKVLENNPKAVRLSREAAIAKRKLHSKTFNSFEDVKPSKKAAEKERMRSELHIKKAYEDIANRDRDILFPPQHVASEKEYKARLKSAGLLKPKKKIDKSQKTQQTKLNKTS